MDQGARLRFYKTLQTVDKLLNISGIREYLLKCVVLLNKFTVEFYRLSESFLRVLLLRVSQG
jgi:hypothetical protein